MILQAKDPLQDRKSRIELLHVMGSDLSIVNDARASFGKQSNTLSEKDSKLINYLVKHQHTSPFRGVVFKFRVKAPLFVCRQWWKHVIASNHNEEQLGWNEKSLRYASVNDGNEFYIPSQFRLQSENNKQATSGTVQDLKNQRAIDIYSKTCQASFEAYSKLLELEVGREQARGVLVPAVYTTWVWTVSLQALLHFIGLRKGEGAQHEIALYAKAIEEMIQPSVPVAMEAWNKYNV